MTTTEIKALVAAKIAGQGTMLDVGNALPSVINSLCDLVDILSAKVKALEETRATTQEVDDFEEFDTTTSYSENDIVRYQGKLYQFDVDHDPGEWDSQEVTQTNVVTILTPATE